MFGHPQGILHWKEAGLYPQKLAQVGAAPRSETNRKTFRGIVFWIREMEERAWLA